MYYKETPGLYKLLFKNQLIEYNKKDEKQLDMSKRTNAIYSHHDRKIPLLHTTKEVNAKH